MTAKMSVSVPDDVAEYLAGQPNASAAVTDAVRSQMRTARTEQLLRAAGIEITDEGRMRWREQLARPIPEDALAEARHGRARYRRASAPSAAA